ncbi:hyaluronidase-3 [Puntigrus tetrazona]|uniref:hyaluronidase-3 n=1 Tax=Puntigrus tetrazona TaxID=1606681 RepID=UPI001C88FBDB|nr:hyaluronidase-3 [Puntigrus tetrazona]XP_043102757.1 hyaluronidase-3 [Puntigrus tetrazona]
MRSSVPHLILTLALSLYLSPIDPVQNTVDGVEPVIDRRTFSVIWNIPTARCQRRYGVSLPLRPFNIIHNSQQRFQGQNMSIFYQRRLGLYPYINRQGSKVNGGLPQQGSLMAHLSLAEEQLSEVLRRTFSGLAVLDWEAWQPIWMWNFGTRTVYRKFSKKLVRWEHPDMSEEKVKSQAKVEFELGARLFMEETLRLGVRLWPEGLWGFYGFPSCYNNHGQGQSGYTGQCHNGTEILNDRLAFLWQQSTALYPSIYLWRKLAGHADAQLMVRHRVLEALRVASQHSSGTEALPVFPYARLAFTHTLVFLNQTDLEHTLGESAALGAAGVVLWGELSFAKSERQCTVLHDYISSVLGEYVAALQAGVRNCSKKVCNNQGRCARRDPHSGYMIPLHGTREDLPLSDMRSKFKCVCYKGWSGEHCEQTVF